MSPAEIATVDQAKAAWAAVAAARNAANAAWWAVGAAFLGSVVNAMVVWAAFQVQREQVKADRRLSAEYEAKHLLGATVAIGETYAGLLAASRPLAAVSKVEGIEGERLRLRWAESIVEHYLGRELPDYILVQDLIRVRTTIQVGLQLLEDAIIQVKKGVAIDVARAPLTNALVALAASLKDIQGRAIARQPELRERSGMPEVLVGQASSPPTPGASTP